MKNTDVTIFLDNLEHPFRKEIELLRNYILTANSGLTENIKWNGPNYCFEEADRITMKIQPPSKPVQLVFHRGVSKQVQPKDKLISNSSNLLIWKENDRAIITFKSLQDIESGKNDIMTIINEWISASK